MLITKFFPITIKKLIIPALWLLTGFWLLELARKQVYLKGNVFGKDHQKKYDITRRLEGPSIPISDPSTPISILYIIPVTNKQNSFTIFYRML
jgi:hypothetical protein